MKPIILTKTNKKSLIYENSKYRVKITDEGYVLKENNIKGYYYDNEINENDVIQAPCAQLTVTNKQTGKTASKRCYQSNIIEDFNKDLIDKKQFKKIFEKIDK